MLGVYFFRFALGLAVELGREAGEGLPFGLSEGAEKLRAPGVEQLLSLLGGCNSCCRQHQDVLAAILLILAALDVASFDQMVDLPTDGRLRLVEVLGNDATGRTLVVMDHLENFELRKTKLKLLLESVVSKLHRHPVEAMQHEADFGGFGSFHVNNLHVNT
jgi:hypothetical protein